MTRKSKNKISDNSDDEIFFSSPEESEPSELTPEIHYDYFDQICDIYDRLIDYTNDQSLCILDRDRFENFHEFICTFVPNVQH